MSDYYFAAVWTGIRATLVPASVLLAVVAVVALFAVGIWQAATQTDQFEERCVKQGGHIKTVAGYKDSTSFCLRDGRILDVR